MEFRILTEFSHDRTEFYRPQVNKGWKSCFMWIDIRIWGSSQMGDPCTTFNLNLAKTMIAIYKEGIKI